jgi:hypothetical protein
MPREIVFMPTEAEAKAALKEALGPLAALGIHWVDGPEPGPRRPGPSVINAPAIEGETVATAYHRLSLRAFHRDIHGAKKRWSADEIVTILNDCWSRATAKSDV